MLLQVRVDGPTGHECNFRDLKDASKGKVCVSDTAQDKCPYDPDHSFKSTTERIFGCETGKSPGTPCDDVTSTSGNADMSGFVSNAIRENRTGDGANEVLPRLSLHSRNFDVTTETFAVADDIVAP